MSVVTVLKQANIFFELTTIQLELIGSICEERTYQAGDMVFAENTIGAELYVIANGEVHIQITTTTVGSPVEVNAASTDTNTDLRTIAVLRLRPCPVEVSLVDGTVGITGGRLVSP